LEKEKMGSSFEDFVETLVGRSKGRTIRRGPTKTMGVVRRELGMPGDFAEEEREVVRLPERV
jgi:hypothetical protein